MVYVTHLKKATYYNYLGILVLSQNTLEMHNSVLNYTFKGNYALGKDGGRVIVWLIVSINRLCPEKGTHRNITGILKSCAKQIPAPKELRV